MNPRAIQALIAFVGMILLGMFLAQWIVTLPPFLQIFAACVFVLIALLCLIKPKVGIDVKFVAFVCLGYAIGGKGFAYVSPFEPFFVSEVCLMLCLTGFLLRAPHAWNFMKGQRYGFIILFIFMSYCGLRLILYDFPAFKLIAIRDSALAYYALFAYCIYFSCKNDDNFFLLKKIFIPMGFLAVFGEIALKTKLLFKVFSVFPYGARIIFPHADITGPLISAFAVTCFFIGFGERRVRYFFLSIISVGLVFSMKTAGVFGFIALIGSLVLFTGRKELIMTGFLSGIMGFIVLAFVTLSGFELDIENEHLETLGQIGEFDTTTGKEDTTSWRLKWWTTIARDTWQDAPFSGAGFGGDISSSFFAETYGVHHDGARGDATGGNSARYPHNVFFTVLGRLGIPLALFFLTIQIGIWLRLGSYSRTFFASGKPDYPFLMAVSFLIAGIANSFVQQTYEAPYAAIAHWVALGFVYGYIQRWRKGLPLHAPPKVRRR